MRKLIPDAASFVFSNGCSDLSPHKRKREIYRGVSVPEVKKMAADMGLVGRELNMGNNILFTVQGVDLTKSGCHLGAYISYSSWKSTDSGESVMEVWYDPEPCSQEEADSYFNQRTSFETKE